MHCSKPTLDGRAVEEPVRRSSKLKISGKEVLGTICGRERQARAQGRRRILVSVVEDGGVFGARMVRIVVQLFFEGAGLAQLPQSSSQPGDTGAWAKIVTIKVSVGLRGGASGGVFAGRVMHGRRTPLVSSG